MDRTNQFKGSLGSFEGVGIKMISFVAAFRRRRLPKVVLASPILSTSRSRLTAACIFQTISVCIASKWWELVRYLTPKLDG